MEIINPFVDIYAGQTQNRLFCLQRLFVHRVLNGSEILFFVRKSKLHKKRVNYVICLLRIRWCVHFLPVSRIQREGLRAAEAITNSPVSARCSSQIPSQVFMPLLKLCHVYQPSTKLRAQDAVPWPY